MVHNLKVYLHYHIATGTYNLYNYEMGDTDTFVFIKTINLAVDDDGFDPRAAAVAKLEEALVKTRAELQSKIRILEERISPLLALEMTPMTRAVLDDDDGDDIPF